MPAAENTGPKGEQYGECCAQCFFGRENLGHQWECHEQPPAVGMVPVATPGAVVGPGGLSSLNWLIKACWRPVKPGDWCGRYRPRAELVN